MELMAYAAHELRTPLAAQRALLELALADSSADVATWREIGEDVLSACRRQERTVDACLAFARSQGGLPRCEPLDIAAIAADVLGAHDLDELEGIVALAPAWTSGDPELVERLIANLVANAIRHNVSGGWVDLATYSTGNCAVVAISNTGPAIPPGELERLFQPFQRLSSHAVDGVGLGLAIVQAIANAHHATVSARARSGGGLGIDIAFPALD